MDISQEQALDCFASDDLIGIGMEADSVRRGLHPEGCVTYVVSRTIAISGDTEETLQRIADAEKAGDTTVSLGFDGHIDFAGVEGLLATIRRRFPSLRLHALSTREVLALAEKAQLTTEEAVTKLRTAGLDSISGDDLSPASASDSLSLESWLNLHRAAHRAGLRSTASLIFGMGESFEQRVACLFAIRALQAETGGFTSFTPLSFKPATSASGLEEPTAVEYLRTLAVSRMVLDNIANIESSSTGQGLKVVQMALRFGANDAGTISSEGRKGVFTEEDLRRVVRDAGFRPVERDTLYQTVFLNN